MIDILGRYLDLVAGLSAGVMFRWRCTFVLMDRASRLSPQSLASIMRRVAAVAKNLIVFLIKFFRRYLVTYCFELKVLRISHGAQLERKWCRRARHYSE